MERYRLYGLSLGMAFQVTDDILGIWGAKAQTGKSDETDLKTKKKTLPVLIGLAPSAELRRLYAGPTALDDEGVAAAVALLDEVGARAEVEAIARYHSDEALAHLDAAQPQGQAAEWLRALTEFLLYRVR